MSSATQITVLTVLIILSQSCPAWTISSTTATINRFSMEDYDQSTNRADPTSHGESGMPRDTTSLIAQPQIHPLIKASEYMYTIGMTSLFILGFVGNILALAVLIGSRRMRTAPGAQYLITIGILDQCVVVFAVLGSHLIRSYTGFDYVRYNRARCKFAYFGSVTCSQSVFYLVAMMSLERALVISFPFKLMHTFTPRRSAVIITVIVSVWILKNLNLLWTQGAVYAPDTNGTLAVVSECGIADPGQLRHFALYVRPWLDYVITFLAVLLVVVANVVIIIAVRRSKRMQKKNSNMKTGDIQRKNRQMIPMLIATSVCFLLLALPLQIVTIVFPNNPNDGDGEHSAVSIFMWSVGLLTSYTNNGVNFYIYCVSGRLFREEMKKLFCRSSDNKSIKNQISTTISVISNHSEEQPNSRE